MLCSLYIIPNTHQMEWQRHHQEKEPQIEVTWIVEFVLIRVVVPTPGQRCPNTLTQGLHNLRAHLFPRSPLRLDGWMMPLLLGYNAMVSSKACCCRYTSMLGQLRMSPQPVSCLVDFSRRCPVVHLFPSQCRFCHCCSRCPHICPVFSLSLTLSLPQMRFPFSLVLSPPRSRLMPEWFTRVLLSGYYSWDTVHVFRFVGCFFLFGFTF